MPQIPQLNADAPSASLRLPAPQPAQGGEQLAQAGEQFVRQYSHLQRLQYHALSHAQSLLALEEYVKDTTQATEAIYAANPNSPTVAQQQTEAMWAKSRERVIKQYGGKDEGIQSAIQEKIAGHDTVHFHQLVERTTKATHNLVGQTIEAEQEAGMDEAIFGSDAQAEHGIKRMADAYGGFQGNALGDLAVYNGMAAATQELSVRAGEQELQTYPARIGARLIGISIDDPSMSGMSTDEKIRFRERAHERNKEALQARQALKGDVLDSDLVIALHRNAIGPKQFNELMSKDRNKPKELTMGFLIDANQISIEELAPYAKTHGIDDPAVLDRARSKIFANLERATKLEEKQFKEVEAANKTQRELQEFAIRTLAYDPDHPISAMEVFRQLRPLVGKPGGFTGDQAAKIVQDIQDIERKVGPDNIRAYNEKKALIEAGAPTTEWEIISDKDLNATRTRELLALRQKVAKDRSKADYFTNQPAYKDVEQQMGKDYQIGPLGIPTVQYAAASKRLHELVNPSGEFKLQPWEAYKRVQKEAPPILKHDRLKLLDPRMENVLTQFGQDLMTEEEVKTWAQTLELSPPEVVKLKRAMEEIMQRKARDAEAAEQGTERR